MTLNIHKGFASLRARLVLQHIREAVRQVGAEVVMLQEVLGEHRGHAARFPNWPSSSQYEYLADSIWSHHSYGQNAAFTDGHHGNALLSKFPLSGEINHDISVPGREKRGVLHCQVFPDGHDQPLHLMCVHLGLSTSERATQLTRIQHIIEEHVPRTAALVVAGDFNDWRGSGVHRYLQQQDLRDAHFDQYRRLARSFPAWWPLLPLDRIYTRGVTVQTTRILRSPYWGRLSDHLPLCMEMSL